MSTLAAFIDELTHDAANVWQKIEAEERLAESEAVKIERAIAPIAEAALVALMQSLKSYALGKVMELGKDEYAALTGQEKQGEVATHLIQIAEGLGHDLTPILISAARTLAQNAFVALGITRPN